MDERSGKVMGTRTRHRRHHVIIGVFFCLVIFDCSCKPKPGPTSHPQGDSSQVTFLEQPVSYCVQKRSNLEPGDVQVLIDGSGSMIGFDSRLPEIVRWSQHAISALHNSSIALRNSRVCTFREKEGIGDCAGMTGQPPTIKSRGNTNLHEAIASARDYSLTFIITDGVAATGNTGNGDCATGVDASCVARSLVESIRKGDASDEPGLWFVPLIAPYDGVFYTEESISPSSFRADETIKKIRSDIPLDVAIQSPRSGPGGKLIFDYKGPRSLLLIVLARRSEIGRAAIEALSRRSEYLNVQALRQFKNYIGGVAAMTPVEVYPGFLNRVRWQSLKESDEPDSSTGTLDVEPIISSDSSTSLQVNCPDSSENSGVYTLIGSNKPDQAAGCVQLQMLPGFSFDLRSVRSEEDSELRNLLLSWTFASNQQPSLEMKVGCSSDLTRRCNQNPISVQLVAIMNYAKTADSIISPVNVGSSSAVVAALSTAHPSEEPHKVSAFSLILENLYRGISGDARSTVLNSFEICKK
jgi:hypothetical protein